MSEMFIKVNVDDESVLAKLSRLENSSYKLNREIRALMDDITRKTEGRAATSKTR